MKREHKGASEQSDSEGWTGSTELYLCGSRFQSSPKGTDTCSSAYRSHRGRTAGSTWLKYTSHVDFDPQSLKKQLSQTYS